MFASNELSVPILIAGAGSTGLSLACELGYRGIPCLVVEPLRQVNPHPRANAVANRTMEYFRRWGVDKALIGAGVPAEYPAVYYWISRFQGEEIHRLTLPGQAELERARAAGRVDPKHELYASPYLKTIVGQDQVERELRRYAAALPSVTFLYGHSLVDYEETKGAVHAVVADEAGRTATVHAEWLVACDGGRSMVRRKAGVELQGRGGLAQFVAIYFKAPAFMSAHDLGPANIFFPIHRRYRGFLLCWDRGTTFTYHLILDRGISWESVDPRAAILALLGRKIGLEILSVQPWSAHALTAEHYRSPLGRVFLAGDAAHLFPPTGGFGMNTGVSDAIDLAWKLGAVHLGFGGQELLASYEAERRPIGIRNTTEAADNFDRLLAVMQWGDELEDGTERGAALRARLKADLIDQEKLLRSSGVLLGYRYERSPICIDDGTEAPPDDPRVYTPTARPGHRAPHAWLSGELSILDRCDPWFTLLCFDEDASAASNLSSVAAQRGLPLAIVRVGDAVVRELYGNRRYVLVRPDLMVAWRGDEIENAAAIVDTVRGAMGRMASLARRCLRM